MPQKSKDSSNDRPVFHADIGRLLIQLRGKRAIQTVVMQARDMGHTVTHSQIRWLEAGHTLHPEASVLKALSAVYGIDYEPLVWQFIAKNYEVTPEFAVPALQLPPDPATKLVAEALEQIRGVARSQVAATLRTLAEALDIDPRTGRTAG